MQQFPAEQLMNWYRGCARDLPWRHTADPYRIWVSEIMLQQTRVEAVRGYYDRFLALLPDIPSLAEADDTVLMKLWEGLGYYSRAKNLKRTAKVLCEQHGSRMPGSFELLLDLPGIGPYTAGAIASIAFGIPVPAIDGNVIRVITRFLADSSDSSGDSLKKKYFSYLLDYMPREDPGIFNQALMELGATVCLPSGAPLCDRCPIRDGCLAHRSGAERNYPVKHKPPARKIEEKTVFALLFNGQLAGFRRPDTGLLASLYQLPELPGFLDDEAILAFLSERNLIPDGEIRIFRRKHIFSHIEWHMKVCAAIIADNPAGLPAGWMLLDSAVHSLPTAYRICVPEYFGK